MLRQIDFTSRGIEYTMLFDSDKMNETQALQECEFIGWGKGCDESLFPYYIIFPTAKMPIMMCIKEFIRNKYNKQEESSND
jgi:hypothetical protein